MYINKLFELEKGLQALSSEERKAQRLKQERPVLEAFWSWIDSIKGQILPKSKLESAVNYALNQKEGLMNYLKDGNWCISNNLALCTGIYNPQDLQKTLAINGISA